MKLTPKIIPEGINRSNDHPLKELGILLGGLLAILVALYLVVGWLTGYYVRNMSAEMEARIGVFLGNTISGVVDKRTKVDVELQKIVSRLSSHVKQRGYDYQVRVSCNKSVNAIALPGGTILVFRGLLEKVKSENELAMIFGHEIGHFQNRDHLRGLGRGLVMMVALSALGSSGKFLSSFLNLTTNTVEMRFSQAQESSADRFGAELLEKEYGHIGGVDHFFDRLKDLPITPGGKKHPGKIRSWFISHPHPENRVAMLEELETEHGWERGSLRPMPDLNLAELCAPKKAKE